jgi:hypothetical protein
VGEEWQSLMKQILHLAENTEREVTHYHQSIRAKQEPAPPAVKPATAPMATVKTASTNNRAA